MASKLFKQFTYKKFGVLQFNTQSPSEVNEPRFNEFIKVLLLKSGGFIQVDFNIYELKSDALFFISPSQTYRVEKARSGSMLYYNRDFYCVEIHDKEVACDGILYNNVYDIPVVFLSSENSKIMGGIFQELITEIENEDSTQEEMLRILLKEIIIKSTRIWKASRNLKDEEAAHDIEFMRKFSRLVELHYKEYHTVSEYANILNITAKALNKRIHKYGKTTPNEIIKNRIILEAKRLLLYTEQSVKEIAYKLGYEDPAYFNRLFTSISGISPAEFKKSYYAHPHSAEGKKVQSR